jgi:hypothetical protein
LERVTFPTAKSTSLTAGFILCSKGRVGKGITASLQFKNAKRPMLYNINYFVRFEAFMAVTMKNGVFWDVTPRGSCKNGRFGGV